MKKKKINKKTKQRKHTWDVPRKESCTLVCVVMPLQEIFFFRKGNVRVSSYLPHICYQGTTITGETSNKLYGNNSQGININLVLQKPFRNKACKR